MICNFCGKTLDEIDEFNYGNLQLPFFYGSKRDGDRMKFSLCSECYDKLADEFMSRCKHEPEIEEMIETTPVVPEWEAKSTEEAEY